MIDDQAIDLRVIKLGGSLLDMAELADVFRRWLDRQPAASNIVLVGGGKLADVVREYDRLHSLSDADAHWLAIRAMELNSRVVSTLLPDAEWLDSVGWASPTAMNNGGRCPPYVPPLAILNPYHFMVDDSSCPAPLPVSWQVTSDTIAARAAERTGAREVVLLKSALPSNCGNIAAATAAGYIDAMFPEASRRLPQIRCVNLRDPTFPEVTWFGR